MKTYNKPEITETKFETKDIIALSIPIDIDGGNTQFPESWKSSTASGTSIFE